MVVSLGKKGAKKLEAWLWWGWYYVDSMAKAKDVLTLAEVLRLPQRLLWAHWSYWQRKSI